VAGHRSPRSRAHSAPVPARDRAAHRSPATGPLSPQVLATAAAVGAVATGALTAMFPGSPNADTAGGSSMPSPVLAASAGVLHGGRMAMFPVETMQPVAYAYDDPDDGTQQVASVEKAGRLAAQLADLHAKEQRNQADRARALASGGLDGWIAQALQIMGLPQDLAPGVKQIILSESGGNPYAVNTWDSNAARGTPSRGLMQTIPSTFRTYVHPSLAGRSINDPVANITAGVRYMVDRYGVDTVRAGGRSSASGSYLGY
jgi:hypothetical protein